MKCHVCKGQGYMDLPEAYECDVKTCGNCEGDGVLTKEQERKHRENKQLIDFFVKKKY